MSSVGAARLVTPGLSPGLQEKITAQYSAVERNHRTHLFPKDQLKFNYGSSIFPENFNRICWVIRLAHYHYSMPMQLQKKKALFLLI
jgi:hypothetical protein